MEVSAQTPSRKKLPRELTVTEGSEATGIPGRTIRAAVQRGAISARRIGGGYLLKRDDLLTFAASHKSRGPYARRNIA